MREFSLLIIKFLTYQIDGGQMIIELLLTIFLLTFVMFVLFQTWKIVKKLFQDSLYSGDEEYIDLEEMEDTNEL